MTPPDRSAKCLLHVFLLTYNREKSLRRTLEALAASPLRDHLLTVMDNCSADGTPAVCAEFRPLLPRMEIRRHERNIGFGPNYMRCLESTEGEYTWIICDDDTFFPERIGALLDLLRDARPEACFVGGPRQDIWPSGPGIRPQEIQRRCGTFLTGQSFVPALVFKSSLVTSSLLVEGYFTIGTKFPQTVVGRKLLLEDIPCAVLRPPVLEREPPREVGTDPLANVDGWADLCSTLPAGIRKGVFYSIFVRMDALGMIAEVLRMVMWMKIDGRRDPAYRLRRIGVNAGWGVRLLLLPCRLAALVPGGVYNLARQCYRKVKYGWLGKPLPATFHTRIEDDDLRR
jgi:glycosyltransferase involved in cell wall biosynthesis